MNKLVEMREKARELRSIADKYCAGYGSFCARCPWERYMRCPIETLLGALDDILEGMEDETDD